MPIIKKFQHHEPIIADDAFIAENATVVGQVTIGALSSIWYGAVLRGDVGHIVIGERSNVQDGACIHCTLGLSNVDVGDDVTIGHGAVVHGAKIGDGALVGMGSVVLDNAEVGEEAIVAAGAVVPPNMKVPPRTLVRGTPARVAKELDEEQAKEGRRGALVYVELAKGHR